MRHYIRRAVQYRCFYIENLLLQAQFDQGAPPRHELVDIWLAQSAEDLLEDATEFWEIAVEEDPDGLGF